MYRIVLLLSLVGASVAGAMPAMAAPSGFRMVRSSEKVSIRPDRAYLLLRIPREVGYLSPILMRVPSSAELAQYEAQKRDAFAKAGASSYDEFAFQPKDLSNLYEVKVLQAYLKDSERRIMLIEADPGQYVLYGAGGAGAMHMCLCLGTVGLEASPGKITDVGTFLGDRTDGPSEFEELAGETDLGPIGRFNLWGVAAGIRPVRPDDEVPITLSDFSRQPAQFHAIGTFLQPGVQQMTRLAPIPGILAYEGGKVIDVRTNRVVPGN